MRPFNDRGRIDLLKMTSFEPGQIWVHNLIKHTSNSRCHFYLPVFKFPEVAERVLAENWNLDDVFWNNRYETFVEVTTDYEAKVIKLYFNDGKYKWVSMKDYQEDERYKSAYISEVLIRPYFYTDDYGRELIAGQLKFMKLNIKRDMTEEEIQECIPERNTNSYENQARMFVSGAAQPVITPTINQASVTAVPFVEIVKMYGLTPKQAIMLLLEEM